MFTKYTKFSLEQITTSSKLLQMTCSNEMLLMFQIKFHRYHSVSSHQSLQVIENELSNETILSHYKKNWDHFEQIKTKERHDFFTFI